MSDDDSHKTSGRPPARRPGSARGRPGPHGPHGQRRGRGRTAPPGDDGPQLIYGLHPVEAALRNPRRKILSFTATQNAANRLGERFPDGLPVEPEIVSVKQIARRLSGDPVHQGALLEVEPLGREDDLSALHDARLVLALDRITDPHNVGAILRTAVAFAADGVIVTTRHAPQESAVLAKSASGALEHIALVSVTNLTKALQELQGRGFIALGLDSEADTALDAAPAGERTILVLGAEGKGLRHGVREACDHMTKIDLPGEIVSLNVSNAAAIALYALTRGRRET